MSFSDLEYSLSLQVIAAAKEGFTAVGYELNPWLVWYSRYRAWREGVQASARFYISDLWKVRMAEGMLEYSTPKLYDSWLVWLRTELK